MSRIWRSLGVICMRFLHRRRYGGWPASQTEGCGSVLGRESVIYHARWSGRTILRKRSFVCCALYLTLLGAVHPNRYGRHYIVQQTRRQTRTASPRWPVRRPPKAAKLNGLPKAAVPPKVPIPELVSSPGISRESFLQSITG